MSNKVTIFSVENYQVKRFTTAYNQNIAHYLSIVSGECNGRPFEALFRCEAGIHSEAFLFSVDQEPFSTSEYQSIRRKIKSLELTDVQDYRDVEPPSGYENHCEYFIDHLEVKHYGKPTYLNIPFDEKDKAKELGAKWCPTNRQWYIRDKHKNHDKIIKLWP